MKMLIMKPPLALITALLLAPLAALHAADLALPPPRADSGNTADQPRSLTGAQLRDQESKRTQPDYVCFVPEYSNGKSPDSHNEHFLVFEGSDKHLKAIWTQAPRLGDGPGSMRQANHICFADSPDGGKTWSKPAPDRGARGNGRAALHGQLGIPDGFPVRPHLCDLEPEQGRPR